MRILHKLLLVGGAVPVLAGAGCLWAYQTLAKARESAAVLSATQALRQEVLLLSLHTDDLVTARQRNDVLAEREAIRLINGATRRTEALLGDIEKGGGRHRLPRAERFDDLRELRDCRELWRLHRDATDEIIRGRAVSRNLEFIHGSAVRLGERLSTMVGGAERRHAACVETGRRVTVATALGVLVLTGIFGWLLHRELLAGFRQASSLMELLSEGTLSPEAELPADGRGEFGGFVRHVNRFLERLRDADRTKDRFLAAM
ncbi:MAG: methyl-accepting chemotaxis protein, partial [Lentisphaeria bacterium]|nr:methyl-accepting chemotaxis protein [Lentisphaeria bacterium]